LNRGVVRSDRRSADLTTLWLPSSAELKRGVRHRASTHSGQLARDRKANGRTWSNVEGVLGAKWTRVRLAHAFDVVGAGLLIWLATALAVDTAANAISGNGLFRVVRVLLAAITTPVAVLWPASRWPSPVPAGQRLVPALLKRSIILGVVLTPYIVAAPVPIDMLVSQISTSALSRLLVAFGAIVAMSSLAAWLGYRLSPTAFTERRDAEMAVGLDVGPTGPIIEPARFDSSSGRVALARSIFETMCAAAVIGTRSGCGDVPVDHPGRPRRHHRKRGCDLAIAGLFVAAG